MNNFPIIDVIKQRSSWRSFDVNSSLSDDMLNQINEYISSAHLIGPFGNIPRFKLVKIPESEKKKLNSEYGTYGFIKGAEFFIAGAISKNNKVLEDFGFIMEQVILKMTELGLGTCWMAGTFKRSTFKRDLNLQSDEILPAITPVGIPSKQRRLVGKLIRYAARAKVRKPWNELFYDMKFDPIQPEKLDEPTRIALEMVRLAPSAKNKQPWRVILDEDHKLHYCIQIDPRKGSVLNYQKLDIGIALCHFELTMRSFEKDGIWQVLRLSNERLPSNFHYVVSWIPQNE